MARKILLADDSVTAQNMGRKILADAGYEVLTVNNGSAALKKIAEAKPELIVLDVYMPGYSGLEVCQRLKEAQETSRIPVLLTVGKLEPFKPEEAKRVRADGYIVKPFEASELLSALSKLEDKIVHGREAAKPGRFARANAALDEGRFDKTVAIEEDSSWKNRIAFPSKKKKAADEETDDSGIYNRVNKDLRTVVDHTPVAKPQPPNVEEPRVNLEALAAEGLPKDVTPEEIAALAAAAAQVHGKIADSKLAEPVVETAPPQAEAKVVDTKLELDAKAVEVNTEGHESKETQPATETPKTTEIAVPAASVDQPEVEKPEETSAASAETSAKVTNAGDSVPAPSSAEVIAAIAALERDADQSSTHSVGVPTTHEPADQPFTMAAAAGAVYAAAPSRWTAVAVTVAPDEAALSLEQEMQQAHAANATVESASLATIPEPTPAPSAEATTLETRPVEVPPAQAIAGASISETHPSPAEAPTVAAASAPIAAADAEPVAPATVEPAPAEPAFAAPDLAEASSPIDVVSTDAITAAVKELEAVAAAYEAQRSATPELAPQALEPQSQQGDVPAHEGAAPSTYTSPEEPIQAAGRKEDEEHEAPVAVDQTNASAVQVTSAVSDERPEVSTPTSPAEVSSNEAANQTALQQSEPATTDKSATRGSDTVKKESEIAETTAAAWASWRRIRESGDPKTSKANSGNGAPSRDEAAMAVAAGAEKSPEEASGSGSGEIDSIVDSVLADLRPKIVEEISRKLGKKK